MLAGDLVIFSNKVCKNLLLEKLHPYSLTEHYWVKHFIKPQLNYEIQMTLETISEIKFHSVRILGLGLPILI